MFKKIVLLSLFCFFVNTISAQNTLIREAEDLDFRRGLELLDREKYGAAREFFERYLEESAESLRRVEAEYYIAYSAMHLFHPDAEILFQNFLAKYPYHSKASQAYYDLGTFYYNNKKYDKAIQYLDQINYAHLAGDQKAEAKFMLGYSYFSLKEFDKALLTFNSIKSTNHKYTYAANYYAGYINYRNANYDAALMDLKVAQQNEAYKNIVPFLIVNIYYRQGEYEELINYSESLSKSGGTYQNAEDIFVLTGEAYFMKNDFPKAAEYFKRHVTEVKGRPAADVQYRLAYAEFRNGAYEDAINSFKAVVGQKDSLGQNAGYYLAISYVRTGNKAFALAAFDQARKLSYNKLIQEEAHFQYGKVNFELEKYSEVIFSFKEFNKNYPQSAHSNEANELLVDALLKGNNYVEALKYIENIKVKSPKLNQTYQRIAFLKGNDEFNSKKFKEAIQSYEKSIQYPVDKDLVIAAYFWQGEAASVLRDYEQAIRSYAALFQRPGYEKTIYGIKTRYSIGYAYYNTKQYDKALPHFREYVKALSSAEDKLNYNDALIRLADLYYVSKNYSDAIKYYDEAIKVKNPDSDYAWYQKGVVYSMMDKNQESKNSFTTVIQQYPTSLYHADAIFQKAQLNFRESNYQEALNGFSNVIENKSGSPYVPYAYLRRAIAYTNLNKNAEAVNDYEVIINRFPKHEVAKEALRGMAQPLTALGRGEEISNFIDKVKAANPDVNTEGIEYDAAYTFYSNDKFPKAIDGFSKYLKSYPDGVNVYDARFFLAESYYFHNDKDNALPYYRQVIRNKDGMYYNRSISRLADISFTAGNLKEANNYYRALLTSAKNKKERSNSWLGLMESYYKLNSYDSSVFFANEILKNGGGSIDAETKALLHLGKVAYIKKDYAVAQDHFLSTINTARDINAVEAQYMIAKILFDQEKYKQSLDALYELNKSFPPHDEWLGRSFLLIADNLLAIDEVFQAKATLNSIIERSPHKETVEKAKQRIKEIEAKEKAEKNKEVINE
ncbi:MAG: tetratricopeptide repeat protein [Cytophagaceae bacterium]